MATLVGCLERLNSNAHFGGASKELLEATVQQLQLGRTEAVILALTRANKAFQPTYENRARYQQIVDEAVQGMKNHHPSSPPE